MRHRTKIITALLFVLALGHLHDCSYQLNHFTEELLINSKPYMLPYDNSMKGIDLKWSKKNSTLLIGSYFYEENYSLVSFFFDSKTFKFQHFSSVLSHTEPFEIIIQMAYTLIVKIYGELAYYDFTYPNNWILKK